MNDVGYIDETYEQSILCRTIASNNNPEQLRLKLLAIEGAINYHKDEQNPKQVLFFESARNEVHKKLKIETKEELKPGTQLSLI